MSSLRVMRDETAPPRRRADLRRSAIRLSHGPGRRQEHLGVVPDLCTVGKAVGGGYPLSVFGGRADIMARLMPDGDCQHSGTYNGHPVMVAAALAAVRAYLAPGFYEHLFAIARSLILRNQRDLSAARCSGPARLVWGHALGFISVLMSNRRISAMPWGTAATGCYGSSPQRRSTAFIFTTTAEQRATTDTVRR